MKTGSQDISPPKDIDDAAQPAQQAKTDPAPCDSPGGATPEDAQPEATTGLAAMPTQEATAEPIAQVTCSSEALGCSQACSSSAKAFPGVPVYGRSCAPFFLVISQMGDGSCRDTDGTIEGLVVMQAVGTTEGAAPEPEAVLAHPLDIGSPAAPQPVLDASQEPAEEAELDAAVAMAEPDVAADGAPMEAIAEEAEEDEDR